MHVEGGVVRRHADHEHEAADPNVGEAVHRLEGLVMAECEVRVAGAIRDPLDVARREKPVLWPATGGPKQAGNKTHAGN